jgi:hypothetical protein
LTRDWGSTGTSEKKTLAGPASLIWAMIICFSGLKENIGFFYRAGPSKKI